MVRKRTLFVAVVMQINAHDDTWASSATDEDVASVWSDLDSEVRISRALVRLFVNVS